MKNKKLHPFKKETITEVAFTFVMVCLLLLVNITWIMGDATLLIFCIVLLAVLFALFKFDQKE